MLELPPDEAAPAASGPPTEVIAVELITDAPPAPPEPHGAPSGVIDVAALTRAAVADAALPDDDLPLAVHVGDWPGDEDSVFIGAERATGSSTRLAPAPRSPDDDDDALFLDPDSIERITERLTGSSARLAPRLPPASRIARIALPPPFPPESA